MDEYAKQEKWKKLKHFLEDYGLALKEELNLRLLLDMDLTGSICWLMDIQVRDLTCEEEFVEKNK